MGDTKHIKLPIIITDNCDWRLEITPRAHFMLFTLFAMC